MEAFLFLTIQEGGREMLKKSGFELLGLVGTVFILFIAQAPADEQGWKKTITLPSGEMICDLNGEWDSIWVGRGEYQVLGLFRDVVKITQQGNSFTGIRTIGSQYNPKGSVFIDGELDKNGFKKLMYHSPLFTGPYKGNLSKDGSKIEVNNSMFEFELNRK
jgi:hypothetical protein